MRLFMLLTVTLFLSGCATRGNVHDEIAPLLKRTSELLDRVEKLDDQQEKKDRAPEKGEAEKPPGAEVPEKVRKEAEEAAEKLYGTWESEEVKTAVGPTVSTIVFNRDKTVKIDTRSTLPMLGHLRTTEGPFVIEGDTMTSESIEGGTTVKFRFEGDDLLVITTKEGKDIRLHRK